MGVQRIHEQSSGSTTIFVCNSSHVQIRDTLAPPPSSTNAIHTYALCLTDTSRRQCAAHAANANAESIYGNNVLETCIQVQMRTYARTVAGKLPHTSILSYREDGRTESIYICVWVSRCLRYDTFFLAFFSFFLDDRFVLVAPPSS